uniref:Glutamine amidotransferase domain-containing protein n=1 Tax=viral metagenome TaxID=1070528 RepID=A0A6C0K0Q7_9ZZZZ
MVRIAVLTMPASNRLHTYSYITEETVKWLRGIEVVPVVVGTDLNLAAALMRSCHGLYMGGGPAYEPTYFLLARHLLTLAVHMNYRLGLYFPVWGVCHGFQMLVAVLGSVWPLDSLDAMIHTDGHLRRNREASGSRLLKAATVSQRRLLYAKKGRVFSHQHGISLQRFLGNESLKRLFRICCTSLDRDGKEYVSLIEGFDLPFYGLQFHPEYEGGLGWMSAFLRRELMKGAAEQALPLESLPLLQPCPIAWTAYGMAGNCYRFSSNR